MMIARIESTHESLAAMPRIGFDRSVLTVESIAGLSV
jgi:hypothetical protein